MRFRKAAAAAVMIGLSASLILGYSQAAYTEEEAPPPTQTVPLRADTMEANSNRQVHPFSDEEVASRFGLEGFELAAESADAELWLSREWNTVRLRNKHTGYVWGALPVEDAEGLNTSWNNYGNAIAAVECFDESGVSKRYGMTGNAATSYTMLGNGFTCRAEYGELGLSFEVKVTLEGNRLQLSVDEDSITEGEGFTLKSLTFLPFLGSGYGDEQDGYLFVPDGSGALIRFQKPTNYSAAFDKKVYGKDLAIDVLADPSDLQAYRPNDYIVEDPQILMPVYGVVHGAYQNAFFGVIDSGAEYASIVANPAAPNNPYNWAAVRFEFRQKYNLSVNRKEPARLSRRSTGMSCRLLCPSTFWTAKRRTMTAWPSSTAGCWRKAARSPARWTRIPPCLCAWRSSARDCATNSSGCRCGCLPRRRTRRKWSAGCLRTGSPTFRWSFRDIPKTTRRGILCWASSAAGRTLRRCPSRWPRRAAGSIGISTP